MALPHLNVLEEILELTRPELFAISENIYRYTLRQILHIFGSIYYSDGNKNKIRVQCVSGKQERVAGKSKQENSLVLPYITIVENGTDPSDDRRRTNQLVSEVLWDAKTKRATRVLSLAPRSVDLRYNVNIWSKYESDINQIRTYIHSLFNPALNIKTPFSDFTQAFIESESDLASFEAPDTTDRKLQKTISIKVETYIPMPKFLYTSNGELKSFNTDVQLFDFQQDMETDIPIETEEMRQKIN